MTSHRVLLALTLVNLVCTLVVLVFTGYVFYVVHAAVESLREVVGQWTVLSP